MSCIQNAVDSVVANSRLTKVVLANLQIISIVLTTIAFMSCQCIFFNGLSSTAVRALACTGLAGLLLHFILSNVFFAVRADLCEPAQPGMAGMEGVPHHPQPAAQQPEPDETDLP